MINQKEIILPPFKKGLHIIDSHILDAIGELPEKGLLNIFIKHTSAGLMINENADPDVRKALLTLLERMAPEGASFYEHTMEGPDDMPAHIKCALTAIQISVPFQAGELLLGTWQGIYLWEHRHQAGAREVIVHLA